MTRPWEIWLVHHTHVDIGYTEPQGGGFSWRYRLQAFPGAFDPAAAERFARETRQPLMAEVLR